MKLFRDCVTRYPNSDTNEAEKKKQRTKIDRLAQRTYSASLSVVRVNEYAAGSMKKRLINCVYVRNEWKLLGTIFFRHHLT